MFKPDIVKFPQRAANFDPNRSFIKKKNVISCFYPDFQLNFTIFYHMGEMEDIWIFCQSMVRGWKKNYLKVKSDT